MKGSSSVCSHISANLYEQQTFNKYLKTAHLSYVSQHHGLSFNFWFMQWAAVKLGSFHLGLSANYSSCVISCKAHKPQAKHFFRDALHIKLSSRMLWFVVLRAWLQFSKLNDVSDLTFTFYIYIPHGFWCRRSNICLKLCKNIFRIFWECPVEYESEKPFNFFLLSFHFCAEIFFAVDSKSRHELR